MGQHKDVIHKMMEDLKDLAESNTTYPQSACAEWSYVYLSTLGLGDGSSNPFSWLLHVSDSWYNALRV